MSGRPDPRPQGRSRDATATKRALLARPYCAACGHPPSNGHHVLLASQGGDDVLANLVSLCGTGTMRCHGALHGSPYVEDGARRDSDWVRARIGEHIAEERPDTIEYVLAKLGDDQGRDHLLRRYYLDLDELPDAPEAA